MSTCEQLLEMMVAENDPAKRLELAERYHKREAEDKAALTALEESGGGGHQTPPGG